MPPFYAFSRPVLILSAALFLSLPAACSKTVDGGNAGAAPSSQAASPQTRPVSRLGDLSAFRSVAVDVAGIVDKGDLPAARTRIRDLELAWDSAEAGLKPRAADDWHVLDKAIDKALVALRADVPNQADCKAALSKLLETFDTLQRKV